MLNYKYFAILITLFQSEDNRLRDLSLYTLHLLLLLFLDQNHSIVLPRSHGCKVAFKSFGLKNTTQLLIKSWQTQIKTEHPCILLSLRLVKGTLRCFCFIEKALNYQSRTLFSPLFCWALPLNFILIKNKIFTHLLRHCKRICVFYG